MNIWLHGTNTVTVKRGSVLTEATYGACAILGGTLGEIILKIATKWKALRKCSFHRILCVLLKVGDRKCSANCRVSDLLDPSACQRDLDQMEMKMEVSLALSLDVSLFLLCVREKRTNNVH